MNYQPPKDRAVQQPHQLVARDPVFDGCWVYFSEQLAVASGLGLAPAVDPRLSPPRRLQPIRKGQLTSVRNEMLSR